MMVDTDFISAGKLPQEEAYKSILDLYQAFKHNERIWFHPGSIDTLIKYLKYKYRGNPQVLHAIGNRESRAAENWLYNKDAKYFLDLYELPSAHTPPVQAVQEKSVSLNREMIQVLEKFGEK